jgi:hypothetical protein
MHRHAGNCNRLYLSRHLKGMFLVSMPSYQRKLMCFNATSTFFDFECGLGRLHLLCDRFLDWRCRRILAVGLLHDKTFRYGDSPISVAALHGHSDCVAALSSAGASFPQ